MSYGGEQLQFERPLIHIKDPGLRHELNELEARQIVRTNAGFDKAIAEARVASDAKGEREETEKRAREEEERARGILEEEIRVRGALGGTALSELSFL